MFTGLVEAVGRILEVLPGEGLTRLRIACDLPPDGTRRGDSVAVDGVCLTVVERHAGAFEVDVVAETRARTTLGRATRGGGVNLERSLRLDSRLGGHLVQGHVDTTARVLALQSQGGDRRIEVELPEPIRHLVAVKGSITLQGVSLTVARIPGEDRFEVALIPETLARTTLGQIEVGEPLNVEVDLLARYLDRWVETRSGPGMRDGGKIGHE